MNPREIIPVPSLRRDAVPGLHARSRSASPSLQWSGQTWIISRPDYIGLKGLIRVLWPSCTFRQCAGHHPQAVKPEPFHLTFWLVWIHPSRTSPKTAHFRIYIFMTDESKISNLPGYLQLFSFTDLLRSGPFDPGSWDQVSFRLINPLAHNICICTTFKPKCLTT